MNPRTTRHAQQFSQAAQAQGSGGPGQHFTPQQLPDGHGEHAGAASSNNSSSNKCQAEDKAEMMDGMQQGGQMNPQALLAAMRNQQVSGWARCLVKDQDRGCLWG